MNSAKKGCVQDGTGTAVSLALNKGIKVINLYFESELKVIKDWLI